MGEGSAAEGKGRRTGGGRREERARALARSSSGKGFMGPGMIFYSQAKLLQPYAAIKIYIETCVAGQTSAEFISSRV